MIGKTSDTEKREAPWSLRGVDNSARQAAIRAAKLAGMPVGQWVGRVIHEAANGEIKENRALGKTAEQQAADLAEMVRQAVATGLQPVNQKLAEIEAKQDAAVVPHAPPEALAKRPGLLTRLAAAMKS